MSDWASYSGPAAHARGHLHQRSAPTSSRHHTNIDEWHRCHRHAATVSRIRSFKLRAQHSSTDSSGKAARRRPKQAQSPPRRSVGRPELDVTVTTLGDNRNDRRAIVKQLLRIQTGGAYAGLLSGSFLLEENDRLRQSRNVTFTVSNIVRWRRQLDFFITHLSGRPVGRLEPKAQAILRLGVYEVVHQNLAPHVISEHVELTKQMVRPGAAKLVNAVLRSLLQGLKEGTLARPPLPTPGMSPVEAAERLAVAASHPTWVVFRWLQRWGQDETVKLLDYNNRTYMQYGVRVVHGKGLTPASLVDELRAVGMQEASVSKLLPADFIRLSGLALLIQNQLLREGQCQVQDEAAGLVVALLDPQPGETILDACAAPGGKALYAASRMQNQGRLVAMDINERRLGALTTAAAAQALQGIVETKHADLCEHAALVAREPNLAEHQYDRVLLDAPCTGLGVLAKRADLRWRRTMENLQQLVTLQEKLLDAAASLVKPGALLVYSTCSIEPEENEDQVAAFLGRHPDFHLEQPSNAILTQGGFFRSLPHVHSMDGAFAARLRRDR